MDLLSPHLRPTFSSYRNQSRFLVKIIRLVFILMELNIMLCIVKHVFINVPTVTNFPSRQIEADIKRVTWSNVRDLLYINKKKTPDCF